MASIFLDKRKMEARGGYRHTVKPAVDEGLLLKAFSNNSALLQNMGKYESISKSQSPDPKGLVMLLPLIRALLDLESTCEIHTACLRKAIFATLLQDGSLNDTKWSGAVWVGMRVERVTAVLFHLRRLAGSDLRQCATRLNGAEFLQLQEVVDRIKQKNKPCLALALPAPEDEAPEESAAKRGLKREVSDVSVNSNGMPNLFGTPDSKTSAEQSPLTKRAWHSNNFPLTKGEGTSSQALPAPSFLRRRPGQSHQPEARVEEAKNTFKDSMGLGKKGTKGKKMKKGKNKSLTKGCESKEGTSEAASTGKLTKGKGKSKTESSLAKGKGGGKAGRSLAKGSSQRKKWTKLQVTKPKKPPWRTYICGTTEPAGTGKLHLIVETTKYRHSMYLAIMDEIKRRLLKDNLTKQEAKDLREHLYKTW